MHQQMMQMHGDQSAGATVPTMPGQDAFGAIQEIVRILDAAPDTDWSKVNLEALRQHLIDMNEVTLKADAAATPIDGGLEIAVTGDGRTVGAIQRMLPAHAVELNQMSDWSAKTVSLPNGVLLTVTSKVSARGGTHPRSWLCRSSRQRRASSAASSRHGDGKVLALTPEQGAEGLGQRRGGARGTVRQPRYFYIPSQLF